MNDELPNRKPAKSTAVFGGELPDVGLNATHPCPYDRRFGGKLPEVADADDHRAPDWGHIKGTVDLISNDA